MRANINTIDVNHLDMDRKRAYFNSAELCVMGSVARNISELKIYEMNHILNY